jgi:hypothetical protein
MQNKIVALEQSMERNFRNYGGYSDFSMGQYGDGTFLSANGAPSPAVPVSRLNPNARLYTLVVSNTTGGTLDVVILNPGDGVPPSNDSIPAGCSVVLQQSSYNRLLTESQNSPMLVAGCKVSVTNAAQFSNVWTLAYLNAAGALNQATVSPLAFRSSLQNLATQIDLSEDDFQYVINQDSRWTIPVNGGEVVTLNLFVKSQIQPTRVLQGQANVAISNQGVPSGLPVQRLEVVNRNPAMVTRSMDIM